MKQVCFFLLFLPVFLFGQENTEECILINHQAPLVSNFSLPQKARKPSNISDLKEIEQSITSLPFIKGYSYNINLKSLNELIEIPDLNSLLPIQNVSFLNTHLFNNQKSNLNLNGSLNINGLTQLVTLKGNLKKYQGNYFLQVSYHVPTNNTSYIPKIVNEKHQNGLALIFKMNLERGK